MTQTPSPTVFFLPRDSGQRLCVYNSPHGAASGARAAVLHVHGFAEEMNKSRRMVALQSRAFAAAGCAVLNIDLLGCGDSSGVLSDADWPAWLGDVRAACDWLTDRHPGVPLWLWGLRAGALLAGALAAQREAPTHLLLWQPMLTGKALVQQVLRLKAAAGLGGGDGEGGGEGTAAKATMATLRQALADGHTVEVAGYPMPARLAHALEAAVLPIPRPTSRVRWFELSTRPNGAMAPASQRVLAAWQAAGLDLQAQLVSGPAFWQTTEIEEAPALIQATVDAVLSSADAVP